MEHNGEIADGCQIDGGGGLEPCHGTTAFALLKESIEIICLAQDSVFTDVKSSRASGAEVYC